MNAYFKAAAWMSGAILSFTAMAIATRSINSALDTFEIMTYRSFGGALILVVALTYSRRWSDISARHLKLHGLRNVAHFAGQNLWFFAVTAMPLAQLFALEFTTPIWVILLSPLMLGTRLRLHGVAAAVIAFVGILIVAQPGVEPLGDGAWAAMSCAIGFAMTYIFTKRLLEKESIYAILFYMTVMQTVFGLAFAGYDGEIALPTMQQLLPLTIVTVTGITAHLSISIALTHAPASICAPIDFVRLPVIAVVGALLYGEPLSGMILLGAALIFGANYMNILLEMKYSKNTT